MGEGKSNRPRPGRRRGVTAVAAALTALAAPTVARAADTWAISIGVRETGSSGEIGSNGGTTGPIEWIDLDGFSINADNAWHTVTWDFAPGAHTATSFAGGNNSLAAANNKGVLEHIRIRNTGGNSGGEIRLRIDDVVNTVGGLPTTITGFEGISTGAANDTVMFREPIFSPSTLANMSTGPNGTLISTASANTDAQSLAARWTFVPGGNTSQWLRLTTNNASILGNPVIDIGPTSSLSIAFRMSVYNPTGTRVRGLDASQFQGSGHDWARAAAPMSAGGGGMSFAFLRATRGGTSGTSVTGSMRVDDPTYAANIAGAKAAGLLTGPYHFGRPDIWTPNDAIGLGNAPGSVGTPEDEARHYLQVAGNVMKPGYLRPVYDLEDGNEELNNSQLTNFVLRFNDTLKKYKGPAAQIIVYAGTTYANSVNEELSQFPLWMPRFFVESDWAAGDIWDPNEFFPPSDRRYGVWADGDPDNTHPWNFWQYYSPDVYIPGINAGTHNDIDVAHGDINYVRQFMVQGAIWDGSANASWTQDANWDTNLSPSGPTEVLFNLGIPATGATISLVTGTSAGGIYFADSYTLSGGDLALTDGRIDVDPTKTATLATSLSAPNGFRKVGQGTLTHASGTSSVTGDAQVLQGTLNVSGGSLDVSGNLLVNPELTQFDQSLVAPFPGSAADITSATLTINGGAVTAATAYVGGTDIASGAIGTLNVASGSLTVAGVLKVWDSAVPMVDSTVNLTGGTLSVGSLDTDGDPASFHWSGGTLAVTGAGGVDVSPAGPLGSTLAVGAGMSLVVDEGLSIGAAASSGTLDINSGGTVSGGSATVSPLGSLNVNAGGTLGIATSNTGLLTLNGGTVTAAMNNGGTMNVTGATPSTFGPAATVDNPGVINVTDGASVAFNAGVAGTGTINVAAGATATTLVVASITLNVQGVLTVNPGAPSANAAIDLSVAGRLDLTDNKLVVLGGTLGTWDGTSVYTGLTGRVDAAHAGGTWTGNGITSSTAAAAEGLTSLGIAAAEQTGHVGGTFGGVAVLAGDVLIMYTYAGDANLDGKINIDDYGRIDGNVASSGTVFGWFNGDFNYDGKINIDDYGIIDGNINRQGAPFSTGTGVESIAAVPEPGGVVLMSLGVISLGRRRRKGRGA